MFPFLQNLFGGGAAPVAGAVPPVNPNPEIMFDPTLGKVVPGSLTPGMGAPGMAPTPTPNPMRNTWANAPDMPPMARGTPSAPPPPAPPVGAGMSAPNWSSAMKEEAPAAPPQSPLQAAIQNQFSGIGSGGEQPPPSAPNSFQSVGSGGGVGGIPLLAFLQANGRAPSGGGGW